MTPTIKVPAIVARGMVASGRSTLPWGIDADSNPSIAHKVSAAVAVMAAAETSPGRNGVPSASPKAPARHMTITTHEHKGSKLSGTEKSADRKQSGRHGKHWGGTHRIKK